MLLGLGASMDPNPCPIGQAYAPGTTTCAPYSGAGYQPAPSGNPCPPESFPGLNPPDCKPGQVSTAANFCRCPNGTYRNQFSECIQCGSKIPPNLNCWPMKDMFVAAGYDKLAMDPRYYAIFSDPHFNHFLCRGLGIPAFGQDGVWQNNYPGNAACPLYFDFNNPDRQAYLPANGAGCVLGNTPISLTDAYIDWKPDTGYVPGQCGGKECIPGGGGSSGGGTNPNPVGVVDPVAPVIPVVMQPPPAGSTQPTVPASQQTITSLPIDTSGPADWRFQQMPTIFNSTQANGQPITQQQASAAAPSALNPAAASSTSPLLYLAVAAAVIWFMGAK